MAITTGLSLEWNSYGELRVIETDAENARDLIEVFGSSSVTSDVDNAKREISKRHARKLAELFHVPVSVFI